MVTQDGTQRVIQLNKDGKSNLGNSWIELILRLFLGIVFVYASWHKILDPAQFAKVLYGYDLLPAVLINLVSIILPFLELFAGFALILGTYPRSAALIVNTLFLAFIIALSVNLVRGHEFDCGCFSFGEPGYTSPIVQVLLGEIICFVVGLYVLFFDRPRRWCLLQSGGILKNISHSRNTTSIFLKSY
jgi:uncharacterized membrane protein YphA (DoxX/SURF4 family)